MIFLDPTEANSQSRLPTDIITQAILCEGLEGLTGADMLISPFNNPPLTNVTGKLGRISLEKHIKSGAVLVQRKSGADVLNFIRDHDQILAKMLKWTEQPWLLTVGVYMCDKDEKLVVEGKRVGGDTGWSYWSLWGALRSWQLRGGYVDNISRDSMFIDWYNKTVKALNPEPVVYAMPRKPSQQIIIDSEESDGEIYQRSATITALATIDNVGIAKAAAIADYAGCLADALVFLSDPANLKYKDKSENYPKGVGSKIFANTSRWLGLKTGGVGNEQWYQRMVIDTVYISKDNTNDNG